MRRWLWLYLLRLNERIIRWLMRQYSWGFSARIEDSGVQKKLNLSGREFSIHGVGFNNVLWLTSPDVGGVPLDLSKPKTIAFCTPFGHGKLTWSGTVIKKGTTNVDRISLGADVHNPAMRRRSPA